MIKPLLCAVGLQEKKPLDEPLLKLPGYGDWTVRDSHEGVGFIGIPGSGKSTAIRCLANAYLYAGFGGVALSVKPSAIAELPRLAEAAGRAGDLHVLNGTNGERYNPFEELNSAADAAALLHEISGLASGMARQESTSEAFWPIERNRLLRHMCELCLAWHGRIDAQLLTDLVRSLPHSPADYADPQWRASSLIWRILSERRATAGNNLRQACDFVEHDFCRQEKRMQGSILAMVRSTLDQLLREPLASLFAGKSTVTMRDVRERGQLLAVGLSALNSTDGRIANAIVQFCFCQRVKAATSERDCFLLSDECQETASKELMSSLAVLREHRVSVVLATQSLGTLNLQAGKEAGESLLSLMGTLFFLKQTHAETREWATKRIAQKKVEKATVTRGGGTRSTSYHEEWVDRVPERRFLQLDIGESFGARGDDFWHCSWPKDGVSGWFKAKVHPRLLKGAKR